MKKKQPIRELTKLTDYSNGGPVYIDICDISVVKIEAGYHDNNNYHHNTLVGTTASIPHNPMATTIYTHYGARFQLQEHISEIIALMEGRDPTPAKILFKGKNDRG